MKRYLCLVFIPAALFFSCNQPSADTAPAKADTAAIKKEITALMDQYKLFANASNYNSIATLYDSSGTAFVNIQEVDYENFDTIKNSYARMSTDTITYFQWKEPMIIDVVKADVVTVSTGYRLYMKAFIDTFHSRYAAVMVKTASGWKIKQETEMPELETARKLAELWGAKK